MISDRRFLEYKLETERKIATLQHELARERLAKVEQEKEYRLELQQIRHEQEIQGMKQKIENPVVTEEEKETAERVKKQAGALLAYCEDRETLEKLGFKLNAEDENA